MHYMGMHAAAERFLARYREASGRSLTDYWAWTVVAVSRPLPDIARWLPSWQAGDRPELTADELRRRHRALSERALAETRAQPH